mmetsp:Transcript_1615/g.5578  ORF Transcript_1615/g.5578 Transcript_1615/m.5578 type:complete len:355 (-) Transcript_1615:1126-2190(-)
MRRRRVPRRRRAQRRGEPHAAPPVRRADPAARQHRDTHGVDLRVQDLLPGRHHLPDPQRVLRDVQADERRSPCQGPVQRPPLQPLVPRRPARLRDSAGDEGGLRAPGKPRARGNAHGPSLLDDPVLPAGFGPGDPDQGPAQRRAADKHADVARGGGDEEGVVPDLPDGGGHLRAHIHARGDGVALSAERGARVHGSGSPRDGRDARLAGGRVRARGQEHEAREGARREGGQVDRAGAPAHAAPIHDRQAPEGGGGDQHVPLDVRGLLQAPPHTPQVRAGHGVELQVDLEPWLLHCSRPRACHGAGGPPQPHLLRRPRQGLLQDRQVLAALRARRHGAAEGGRQPARGAHGAEHG